MSDFTGTLTELTPGTTARGAPKAAFTLETPLGNRLRGVAIDHVAADLIRRGQGARVALRGVIAPYSCTAFEKGALLIERLMPAATPAPMAEARTREPANA